MGAGGQGWGGRIEEELIQGMQDPSTSRPHSSGIGLDGPGHNDSTHSMILEVLVKAFFRFVRDRRSSAHGNVRQGSSCGR